jgi:hypothetical protein
LIESDWDVIMYMSDEKAGATQYDSYVEGAKDPWGRTIKSVIGRHRTFVVYTDAGDDVRWNYDHLPERLRPAVSEFQSLAALASSCLTRKQLQVSCPVLASALYGVFLTQEGKDPKEALTTARDYIRKRSAERVRLSYVLLSMTFACCFLIVALLLRGRVQDGTRAIIVGASGGVIGAAISITQRGWKLPVDPVDSVIHVACQGLVRVIIGGAFGSILVGLSKANLAFGGAANDLWALFGLSVAAGISERLVPDLLARSTEA